MSKAIEDLKKIVVNIRLKDIRLCEDEFRNIEKELIFADTMKHKLERWLDLLQADGINSKNMVMNDIQYLLKELKESESGRK